MHSHPALIQDTAPHSTKSDRDPLPKPQGTMAWTVKFLERCAYRTMTSDEDLEHLARWRWQHYMEQETIKNRSMTIQDLEDGKDRLPTARNIGLYLDGALVSAMRVHAITAEAFNIGVLYIGRERIEREVANGKRFVYSGRWVSDPKHSASIPLIIATTRLIALACEYHKADYAISISRENHVKTFVKLQNAVLWTDKPVPLENFDYLYHFCAADYHAFKRRIPIDRQAYFSSAREREEMFGDNADNLKMIRPSAGDVLNGTEESGF